MKVIHVARKPLSEKTVASNVVKHGTGGINIDASRLGTGSTMRSQKPQNNGQSMNNGQWKGGATGSTKGRWPANVILQHLDGCQCLGVRKFRSSSGSPQTQGAYPEAAAGTALEGSADATLNQHRSSGYRNADGTETVAAWECAPGCPVTDLDEQTGDRPSTWTHSREYRHSEAKPESKFRPNQGAYMTQGPLYGDKGGASRFFKQVGGKPNDE